MRREVDEYLMIPESSAGRRSQNIKFTWCHEISRAMVIIKILIPGE